MSVSPAYTGAAQPGIPQARLAPHETLELHELLAFDSSCLVRMKMTAGNITDPELKQLYLHAIHTTEREITELVRLLQMRYRFT